MKLVIEALKIAYWWSVYKEKEHPPPNLDWLQVAHTYYMRYITATLCTNSCAVEISGYGSRPF